MHHENVMPVLLLFSCGYFALGLVLIACELGQRMADAFEKLHNTIDQWDWYLFPLEIKRILIMVIAIAQKPVSVECFGSIACTRETFKDVGLHSIQ